MATSFDELRRLVEPGDTIYVTNRGGSTIKGKLATLSTSSLELRVGRDAFAPPVRMPESDLNNIVLERSDSLWNGALFGLAGAALPVALIGLVGRSEYEAYDAAPVLGMGVIGLAIGLLIDVLNKERITIYVHAAGPRSSGVRVSPLLSKSGIGLQMFVGF